MFSSLFRKKETDTWNADKINKIIDAYSAHLENHAGPIEDENKLPFKKGDIKRAILLAIRFTPDTESRNALRSGYLRLCSFQYLSAAELTAVEQMSNALAIKPNQSDVIKIAEMISRRGETYEKISSRTHSEMLTLQKELNTVLAGWGIA